MINIPVIKSHCNWQTFNDCHRDIVNLGFVASTIRRLGYSANAEADITAARQLYKISTEVKGDEPSALLLALHNLGFKFNPALSALADVHCRGTYSANCLGTEMHLRLWDAFKD